MAECVRDKTIIHIACQLCGKMDNLMICGGCKRTWYCGKEHQKYDWKYHKKKCKRTRQEHEQQDAEEESGQGSINSNGMSTSFRNPRVTGLRDSSVVFPSSIDDDKSMNNSKATESVFTSGSVSRLERLNLEENTEEKEESAVNGTPKDFFIQDDIRELKPFTTESVKQNISQKSSDTNSANTMAPTTDDEEFDTSKTYFSVLETRTKMLADYACNCLNRYGICVIDNFLGNSKGLEILNQVKDMHQAGIFKKGQLMNSNKNSNSKHVRGDILTWVDGSEEGCQDIGFLISSMDAVVLKCAGKLRNCTVNGRTKGMVACYPGGGTQYLRHVDNPNDDGRCITCIYYLNKDWDAKKYGGLLRIYPEGEDRVASIEPLFDRLLFFWSDRRNPHEVMQAFKTRYAITVWYYDADQRERAVKKHRGAAKSEIVPLLTGQTRKE